ncbi:DNA mismatch repair protein mutL [Entamoeba marina]
MLKHPNTKILALQTGVSWVDFTAALSDLLLFLSSICEIYIISAVAKSIPFACSFNNGNIVFKKLSNYSLKTGCTIILNHIYDSSPQRRCGIDSIINTICSFYILNYTLQISVTYNGTQCFQAQKCTSSQEAYQKLFQIPMKNIHSLYPFNDTLFNGLICHFPNLIIEQSPNLTIFVVNNHYIQSDELSKTVKLVYSKIFGFPQTTQFYSPVFLNFNIPDFNISYPFCFPKEKELLNWVKMILLNEFDPKQYTITPPTIDLYTFLKLKTFDSKTSPPTTKKKRIFAVSESIKNNNRTTLNIKDKKQPKLRHKTVLNKAKSMCSKYKSINGETSIQKAKSMCSKYESIHGEVSIQKQCSKSCINEKLKQFTNNGCVKCLSKKQPTQQPIYTKHFFMNSHSFSKNEIKNLIIIGQADTKYIICMNPKTRIIYGFDQHAVHERFLYESNWKLFEKSPKKCTSFIKCDILIDLSPNQKEVLKKYRKEFEYLQFIYELQSTQVTIKTFPIIFERSITASKFIKMVNQIIELKYFPLLRNIKVIQNIIASVSCRNAIMFNDELSMEQCKYLIESLQQCQTPFICAHGRPNIVPLFDLTQLQDCAKNY